MARYSFNGTVWNKVKNRYSFNGTVWNKVRERYSYNGSAWNLVYRSGLKFIEGNYLTAGNSFILGVKDGVDNGSTFAPVVLRNKAWRGNYFGNLWFISNAVDVSKYTKMIISATGKGSFPQSINPGYNQWLMRLIPSNLTAPPNYMSGYNDAATKLQGYAGVAFSDTTSSNGLNLVEHIVDISALSGYHKLEFQISSHSEGDTYMNVHNVRFE